MKVRVVSLRVSFTLSLVVMGVMAVSVVAMGRAAQDDEYPRDAMEALEFYESWDENWLSGPVEYLILDDEREVWESLETTEQRQAFKDWFWMRRNQDARADENKVKKDFYERVGLANQRFRGFPKGWKSDRGRVWVIVGKPDGIRRATSQQLFGINSPQEFVVWTYFTVGGTVSRAFSTNTGEYYVFFIEERIGNPEIFDYRMGAGVWPLELRQVFEYTREALIFNPQLEFAPAASDSAFVRSVTESNMPFEVLADDWGDLGAGGTAVFPMQVALRDLLFENDAGSYVARLEVGAEIDPAGGGDKLQVAQRWVISLPQQLLAELGTGTLLSVLALDAPPGEYSARVGITQPVSESRGQWEGSFEIAAVEESVASAAVGRMSIPIDAAGTQQLALLSPRDGRFPQGSSVFALVWVRGSVPSLSDVSMEMVTADGTSIELEVESSRWVGGPAGPLVIESRFPEVEPGAYELHVSLGGGLRVGPLPVRIDR